MQRNVLEYLDAAAQRFAEKMAFDDNRVSVTFKELKENADIIGSGILAQRKRMYQRFYGNRGQRKFLLPNRHYNAGRKGKNYFKYFNASGSDYEKRVCGKGRADLFTM